MTIFKLADKRFKKLGYTKTKEKRDYVLYEKPGREYGYNVELTIIRDTDGEVRLFCTEGSEIAPLSNKTIDTAYRKIKELGW